MISVQEAFGHLKNGLCHKNVRILAISKSSQTFCHFAWLPFWRKKLPTPQKIAKSGPNGQISPHLATLLLKTVETRRGRQKAIADKVLSNSIKLLLFFHFLTFSGRGEKVIFGFLAPFAVRRRVRLFEVGQP